MDLTVYDIIKGPVVSDRSYKLNKKLKKLVINVHPAANKVMIAAAVEFIFKVKVQKVCVSIRKGKRRMVKRALVQGSLQKKAIITFAPGYSLNMFDQTDGQGTSVEAIRDNGNK